MTTHLDTTDQRKASLKLSERYSHFLLRRKRWFLAILAITTVLAIAGLTQVRFDGEPREIFKQGDEEFALLEEYFEQFGPDDNGIILVLDGQIFSSAFAQALRGFTTDAQKLPDVLSVLSLLDVPGPNKEPLLPSPDSEPPRRSATSINHQLWEFSFETETRQAITHISLNNGFNQGGAFQNVHI